MSRQTRASLTMETPGPTAHPSETRTPAPGSPAALWRMADGLAAVGEHGLAALSEAVANWIVLSRIFGTEPRPVP